MTPKVCYLTALLGISWSFELWTLPNQMSFYFYPFSHGNKFSSLMKSEVGTKGAVEGVSLKRKKPAEVSGCAN